MINSSFVCGEFTFKIEMDDIETPRFGDEGIIQKIILYANDYILFKTGWGSQHLLETIEREKYHNPIEYGYVDVLFTEDTLYFLTDGFQEFFHQLEGENCMKFYNWLITTIDVSKSRMLKIEKIRNLV